MLNGLSGKTLLNVRSDDFPIAAEIETLVGKTIDVCVDGTRYAKGSVRYLGTGVVGEARFNDGSVLFCSEDQKIVLGSDISLEICIARDQVLKTVKHEYKRSCAPLELYLESFRLHDVVEVYTVDIDSPYLVFGRMPRGTASENRITMSAP